MRVYETNLTVSNPEERALTIFQNPLFQVFKGFIVNEKLPKQIFEESFNKQFTVKGFLTGLEILGLHLEHFTHQSEYEYFFQSEFFRVWKNLLRFEECKKKLTLELEETEFFRAIDLLHGVDPFITELVLQDSFSGLPRLIQSSLQNSLLDWYNPTKFAVKPFQVPRNYLNSVLRDLLSQKISLRNITSLTVREKIFRTAIKNCFFLRRSQLLHSTEQLDTFWYDENEILQILSFMQRKREDNIQYFK
jgi:hypothetical protein